MDRAKQAARASGPVLILGERGTGKELFARLVHQESARAGKPLISVNCATLNPALADALLFGHVRGAFTGAVGSRGGFVGAAQGGTLFLDEVGELPLEVQARLLRLLQEGRVVAVGEEHERPVNVRIVAATNRDLHAMARDGRFREDLLDRLAVWELRLPPLRERRPDLRELAEVLLEREPDLKGRGIQLGRSAATALRAHDWPGNVRELQRVLLRAAAHIPDGSPLLGRHIRAVLGEAGGEASSVDPGVERRLLDALVAGELCSMATLVARTGLPRSTLKAAVTRLIVAGRVGRAGVNRGTRYWRVADAGVPSPSSARHPLARAALAVLEGGGPQRSQEIAAALGVSPSTALRALASLVDEGLVTRDGLARATLYRATSASPAAPPAPAAPEALPPPKPAPPARERSALERLALDLADASGTVARRELVRASGYSPRSALRALRRLEAEGELIRVCGSGCTTRYGRPGWTPPPRVNRSPPTRAPARSRRRLDQDSALALAVALACALQRGPIRPSLLERHVGVPLDHARAALTALAARGLLIATDDGFTLAPPDDS